MKIISLQWTLWTLLGVGVLSATKIAAYEVTIKNATKQDIFVTIDQVMCSPIKDFRISAGETKTIETGVCCSKMVTITGSIMSTTSVTRMSTTYEPPLISGTTCRGYSITVSLKGEGYLAIEEGIH
jgi:hypothetical protein